MLSRDWIAQTRQELAALDRSGHETAKALEIHTLQRERHEAQQPPALSAEQAAAQETATPQGLLDAWVELWGTYDLDRVHNIFLRDDSLSYFSSEFEGQLRGFERIVEHHRGFGFVPGGDPRDTKIWVREVQIDQFGDAALIGAIWYFGDPAAPDDAQRGPMTVFAVRTPSGYRIAHMHFATYEGEGAPAPGPSQVGPAPA